MLGEIQYLGRELNCVETSCFAGKIFSSTSEITVNVPLVDEGYFYKRLRRNLKGENHLGTHVDTKTQ